MSTETCLPEEQTQQPATPPLAVPAPAAGLALKSELVGAAATFAVPVCMTLAAQAALVNNQSLNVILAVIDDDAPLPPQPTTTTTALLASSKDQEGSGGSQPGEEQRGQEEERDPRQARRRRPRGGKKHGRHGKASQAEATAAAAARPVTYQDVERLLEHGTAAAQERGKREERVQQACGILRGNRQLAGQYAAALRGRLDRLMQSRAGVQLLAELVAALPFGRGVRADGDAALLLQELVDALPRQAMQPLGRLVYGAFLRRCANETGPSCQLSRALAERLARHVLPLALCQYGSSVLLEALELASMKGCLEGAVCKSIEDVCSTPQGCRFLDRLLALGSQEVAMALLESQGCLRSLRFDREGCGLLRRAADFGASHRAQLAETLRRSGLEVPESVKVAACWK